jgi:hypothetical protein
VLILNAHRRSDFRFNRTMDIAFICGGVACSGYWFYAGEELGYPRWVGALLGCAAFFAMVHIWPGGVYVALGAQIALAVLIGAIGALRLSRK